MPGVPPDAVAQVKKGLRGLFNRRKSRQSSTQQSQPQASSTPPDAPAKTTTAAAAAPVAAAGTTGAVNTDSTQPPPPQPASDDLNTKAPQLSQPAQVEEAKDIDLNPAQSSDDASKIAPAIPASAEATTEPLPKGTAEPLKPGLTQTSTGMSATSGPLGDHLGEGYDYASDGDDGGPKGETLSKPEDVGPKGDTVPKEVETKTAEGEKA